ncbi:MAG: hypothetical protein NNA30_00115 [Nitrospira sp.]|nr:hypothetical protein [Nitrospira sp.]
MKMNRKCGFGLMLGVILLTSGCQSSQTPNLVNGHHDNDRFMSLWQRYNACKVASDFERAHLELKELSSVAFLKEQDGFVLPLPTKLQRWVSAPTNRQAVDVRAMAASCSLRAGQLAIHEGQIDTARDLFSSVLTHHKDVSPYYVVQAKRLLAELDRGVIVSLKTP